jgi:integrase
MIVDLAAHTGARRNEIIALTWDDLDLGEKTISITRAVEDTVAFGRHVKEPKSARGRRTIGIDAALVERLAHRNVIDVVSGVELLRLSEKKKQATVRRWIVAFNVVPV